MALIWAEQSNGATLAAAASRYHAAERPNNGPAATDKENFAAFQEAIAAKKDYEAQVQAAEEAFAAKGARTHVLVIGVGAYQEAGIPAVTTSVHGAHDFADFVLEGFRHDDRPLGSVELVVSPGVVGDYQPSAGARARLGLPALSAPATPADAVVVEPALMANIRAAFDRWLTRAKQRDDNAALLYISCHGVWRGSLIVLPEDAQPPAVGRPTRNLIDIGQTLTNMYNTAPGVQCFFVDACQELTAALAQTIAASVAESLYLPGPDALVPRDASLFAGSCPGLMAYGPPDAAPYFTQELIECLKHRGADTELESGVWSVTTDSLRVILPIAARYRGETENLNLIRFSDERRASSFPGEICRIYQTPQVFACVSCGPPQFANAAHLYLQDAGGARFPRRFPAPPDEWCLPLTGGGCTAGADFDPGSPFTAIPKNFTVAPPRGRTALQVVPVAPAVGGGTGGHL